MDEPLFDPLPAIQGMTWKLIQLLNRQAMQNVIWKRRSKFFEGEGASSEGERKWKQLFRRHQNPSHLCIFTFVRWLLDHSFSCFWQDPMREILQIQIHILTGLPLWLSWKRICLQCGRPGFNPWVGKIPWRRERQPIPVFWPEKFHGLYSPWGRKELDMTERFSLSLPLSHVNLTMQLMLIGHIVHRVHL